MSKTEFNLPAFYAALNSVRAGRNLNWKQVAELSGVSASTLSRLSAGKRPDVDSLSALIAWSGLSADNYVAADRRPSKREPLAEITAVLQDDPSLTDDNRDAMLDIVRAAYLRLQSKRK